MQEEQKGFLVYYRVDGGLQLFCFELDGDPKAMRPSTLLELVATNFYEASFEDWNDSKKTFYIYDSEKDDKPRMQGDVYLELVPQFFVSARVE